MCRVVGKAAILLLIKKYSTVKLSSGVEKHTHTIGLSFDVEKNKYQYFYGSGNLSTLYEEKRIKNDIETGKPFAGSFWSLHDQSESNSRPTCQPKCRSKGTYADVCHVNEI